MTALTAQVGANRVYLRSIAGNFKKYVDVYLASAKFTAKARKYNLGYIQARR